MNHMLISRLGSQWILTLLWISFSTLHHTRCYCAIYNVSLECIYLSSQIKAPKQSPGEEEESRSSHITLITAHWNVSAEFLSSSPKSHCPNFTFLMLCNYQLTHEFLWWMSQDEWMSCNTEQAELTCEQTSCSRLRVEESSGAGRARPTERVWLTAAAAHMQ